MAADKPHRARRYLWQVFKICSISAGAAAITLLAVGTIVLFVFAPSESLQVVANKQPQTKLGGGSPSQDKVWKVSVSFAGSGYVYLLSQTADGSRAVDPKDSVQVATKSERQLVVLPTPFDSNVEYWLVCCVTDRPAGALIEAAWQDSGISLDHADRGSIKVLRNSIEQALKARGVGLVNFSPDVTHLTGP